MKTLNQLIGNYTALVRQGQIQLAYKGILEFIGKLRADFMRKYPHDDVSGVYQGYMDMSYFSVSAKPFKDKGLKIAIVYLHEKGCFEVWLSARNRALARQYESAFQRNVSGEIALFHDENNPDAIIECTLASAPNFEDQALLTDLIGQGVERFITAVNSLLAD
jgi:hypothetical protein